MRAKRDRGLMAQFSARAAFIAMVTASRFSTGSAPGKPRHTGQTLELGGSPKCVEQEQKILDFVRSWTCTSRPITASYLVRTSVAAGIVPLKTRNHPDRALYRGRVPGVRCAGLAINSSDRVYPNEAA